MKIVKNLSIILVMIVLIIAFTPLFGSFYEYYVIGRKASIGFFWGLSNPQYLTGFMFSGLFFCSFISWLFSKRNKFRKWLYSVIPFLLIFLVIGSFLELLIGFVLSVIGLFISQIILFFYKTIKNKIGKNV